MKSSLTAVLGIPIVAVVLSVPCGCAKKEQAPALRSEACQPETRVLVPNPAMEGTAKAPEKKSPDPVAKTNAPPPFEPVELNTFQISRNMDSVAFSPDGKTLVATSWYGGFHNLKAWDLTSGKEIPFPGGKDRAFGGHVAFHPDGGLLVPVRAGQERGEEITVWNFATGQANPNTSTGFPHLWAGIFSRR